MVGLSRKSAWADHFFCFKLADFVIVAVLLSDVEFAFHNPFASLAAHISGRHVMKLANARLLTESQHVGGAVEIGTPRFLIASGALKGEAGRVVHKGGAVVGCPAPFAWCKSEFGAGEVSFEDDRSGKRVSGLCFPTLHQAFDPLLGRGELGAADQDR